jgi:DNA polymerase-3 subunit epsilon
MTGFTGAAVCTAHGMSVTSEPAGPGRAALRFALPLARPDKTRPSRAVLYDFDLLNADIPEDLAAAKLKDLSFVVFDTETTGLNPQVDEVCQIAAVRVVNGKLLDAERFDMLVNPGRKIPAASTAVHHITDEMVADAPGVAEAMARFHTFADGCVLVAHNAPFDMAFLRRRTRDRAPLRPADPRHGPVFGDPLRAIGGTHAGCALRPAQHHDPRGDRHTAIGDAIGTADAFRKMIPMLEAAELPNLGALIKAFDRHSRLIEHLN